MAYYSENMNQAITYWAPGVPDGFGGLDFTSSERDVFQGRWEDKAVLFRDANGQEQTSSAILYLPFKVTVRGYVFLGNDINNLTPQLSGVAYREIRAVGVAPSLDDDQELVKVFV